MQKILQEHKINFKIFIFVFITFVTISWIIFYSFFYTPTKPLFIYFTYQSNFLVWVYYSFWFLGLMLLRFNKSTSLFNFINNYRFKHFIATIITTTGIFAVFILAPFELTYNLIDSSTYKLLSKVTVQEGIYITLNSFFLHVVIPLLVMTDLFTDYYDVDKISKNTKWIPFTYFILYLFMTTISGSITGVFPYTPLNPGAFNNVYLQYIIPLFSLVIGVIGFSIIDYVWLKRVENNNGGFLLTNKAVLI